MNSIIDSCIIHLPMYTQVHKNTMNINTNIFIFIQYFISFFKTVLFTPKKNNFLLIYYFISG